MATKAQQTYERIEALIAEGVARPDAIKQLAEEFGQSTDSVRGAYYTGRKQTTGEATAPRTVRPRQQRETTDTEAIAWAVTTLENAITSIETEVEQARVRAEEARAEYDSIEESSGPRIAKIRAKIAALHDGETESPSPKAPPRSPDPGSPRTRSRRRRSSSGTGATGSTRSETSSSNPGGVTSTARRSKRRRAARSDGPPHSHPLN